MTAITPANIGIDFLQGQYDQAVPTLAMEALFTVLFGGRFCFTPESPLVFSPLPAVEDNGRVVMLLPLSDEHQAEYLAIGLMLTTAGTVWLQRRERRRKPRDEFHEHDALFAGTHFDKLCRDLEVP